MLFPVIPLVIPIISKLLVEISEDSRISECYRPLFQVFILPHSDSFFPHYTVNTFLPSESCCCFSPYLKYAVYTHTPQIFCDQCRHHFCKNLSLIHFILRMSPCPSLCIYPLMILLIT